jgi:hypothetical protein
LIASSELSELSFMSYYQCPKCGGRDTYQGTELVSGSKGGGAIIGPENDMGFSPVVGVGGRTTTSEQTVVKCKTCDINLGEKDRHLTPDETEDHARWSREYHAAKSRRKKYLWGFAITLVPIWISFFTIWQSFIRDEFAIIDAGPVDDAAFFLHYPLSLVINALLWWTIIRRRKKSQR